MPGHPHEPARGPSLLARRWRRLRDARDRGDATVEAVIIVPILVVLTLLVVQFVLVWHGRHVAQAAAQNAARSAAAYQAQAAAGPAAGDDYLGQVAPHLLPGRSVTVTRDAAGASRPAPGLILGLKRLPVPSSCRQCASSVRTRI